MSLHNSWKCIIALVVIVLATGCSSLGKPALGKSDFIGGEFTPEGMRKLNQLGKSNKKKWAGDNKFVSKIRKAMPSLGQSKKKKQKINTTKPKFEFEDSKSLAKKAKEIGPTLHLSAARVAEQQGRPDVAEAQYQAVLATDGNNRNALIGLARLQHRGGNTPAAIQIYQQATTVHPNDAVILNDLGLCYAQNGQFAESIDALRRATSIAPGRKMYVNNLAAALVQASRTPEAVAYLANALGPAEANMHVGYLLSQTGQYDEANAYLNHALALKPNLSQARAMLDQISPRVSSLPKSQSLQDSRQAQRTMPPRKPIVSPVDPLSNPQAFLPRGGSSPAEPGEIPTHLEEGQPRFGPFGFAPRKNLNSVEVVSFAEEIE